MLGSVERIWYSIVSLVDAVAVWAKPSFLPVSARASRTVFSSVGMPVRFLGYTVTSYIQRSPPSSALLPFTDVIGRERKNGAVVSVTISGTFVSTIRYSPRGRSLAEVWP